jgi:hypothetical protein
MPGRHQTKTKMQCQLQASTCYDASVSPSHDEVIKPRLTPAGVTCRSRARGKSSDPDACSQVGLSWTSLSRMADDDLENGWGSKNSCLSQVFVLGTRDHPA